MRNVISEIEPPKMLKGYTVCLDCLILAHCLYVHMRHLLDVFFNWIPGRQAELNYLKDILVSDPVIKPNPGPIPLYIRKNRLDVVIFVASKQNW